MPTEIREDTANQYPWETIESIFDDLGNLIQRTITYDNGIVRDEQFMNGIRSQTVQLDNPGDPSGPGAAAWDSIETFYDPAGDIAGRLTTYDNGIVRDEQFMNGVRKMTRQSDNPLDVGPGVAAWDNIYTNYDPAGQIASRDTDYDNGIFKTESFQNGVRSLTIQIDNPGDPSGTGVAAWSKIATNYDLAGVIEARVTIYDNGIVRSEQFQGGVRSLTTQLDNPDSFGEPGVAAWDRIETFYDPAGDIAGRLTTYDNGIVRDEQFMNGIRSQTVQLDNPGDPSGPGAAAWDSIETFYDPAGDIARRFTTYDNGITRDEQFEGGVRSVTIQLEDPFVSGPGVAAWDRIETYYDAAGQIALRSITYDNGIDRMDQYENGNLAVRLQFDNSVANDAAPWTATRQFFGPDGQVERSARQDDNGDEFIFDFDNGDLVRGIEHDVDNSDPWLLEVTTYDATGAVDAVVTYDSFAEAPMEISEIFGWTPIPVGF